MFMCTVEEQRSFVDYTITHLLDKIAIQTMLGRQCNTEKCLVKVEINNVSYKS